MRAWLLRLAGVLGSARRDRELADELESHLQLHIDDNVRAGMTLEEARRDARLKLGGVTQTAERYRDRRGVPVLDALIQDVRYAVRILTKHPGFGLTAILTMALGIGATSAIFTVVHAVLLRPLPYPASHELVSCVQRHEESGPEWVTWPDYSDWRTQTTRLKELGAAWQITINLTGVEEPERLSGAAATASLFPVLGVSPALGRVFLANAEEDARTVVLAHGLWRRRFGADRSVLGRTVQLNGRPHTVVGVMPEGFAFPAEAELWVPFVPEPGMNRGYHLLQVVGRMRPDVTVDQVGAELSAIATRAGHAYPTTNKGWGAQVSSLLDGAVSSTRPALLVLAAAVACVLLIACVNVAALLVSRAAARRHEIALREALGASRGRIARQLLTESVLLALCGGAAGLAFGAWAIDPLLALTTLPRAEEVSLDGTVVLFTLVTSVVTGVCFGLAPALTLLRRARDFTPASRISMRSGALRPLVATEVGLAVVLLTGAGLLGRSFHRLQQVDTGFSGDRVLTVRFFLPRAAYSAERAVRHYQQMIDRMRSLPEVEAVAAVSHFPFSNLSANAVFDIRGRPAAAPGQEPSAEFRSATPGYFRAMGIPLVRGRDFAASDHADAPFVAIVNRATVERYFPGQNPFDQSVRILGPKPRRIVGVVENIRHRELDRPPVPEIYVPHPQFPTGGMFLAIRIRSGDPARLAGTVRSEIRALDPDLPIASIRTWRSLLNDTLSRRRVSLVLVTVFATTALVLAVVGVYCVLSFLVSQRTREIGIRMALGARRRDVLTLTLRQGMVPVVLGLLMGIVAALGATRVLTSMLYEVRPTDPITLASVAGLLLAASLAATTIPARRAAAVDPMMTLRHE